MQKASLDLSLNHCYVALEKPCVAFLYASRPGCLFSGLFWTTSHLSFDAELA